MNDGAVETRLARLSEPHVLPLMNLIKKWRSEGLIVPNLDPLDGGINARALFLLESPGPKAVSSNFISRNNKDPSARNMKEALEAAGFSRADTLLWNVVPYCVSTSARNGNASNRQVREAIPKTQEFINLLPHLSVIVLCGRKAQLILGHLNVSANVLTTYHPATRSYNHYKDDIRRTFKNARSLISL